MTESISAKELITKVWIWRKTFLWITIIAAVVMGVVVFLLPKQYKSTAILFPGRQFSVSKLVIDPNMGNQEDYMEIGDEDDCEKLIQILTSDALKLKVADKFDLWARWKLRDEKFALHYLRLKWDDMVAIKRTEFNSVKIEVYDYTANHAAELANGISDYSDTIRRQMMQRVSTEALKIVKLEYDSTWARVNAIDDSMKVLRHLGVFNYKEQVKAYSKAYAVALAENNTNGIKRLQAKFDTLEKFGGSYQNLHLLLKKYSEKLTEIKLRYDAALVNCNSYIPTKFVVEKAKPNEFKAKPKRMIILAISVLACNVLGLFVLLIKERLSSRK